MTRPVIPLAIIAAVVTTVAFTRTSLAVQHLPGTIVTVRMVRDSAGMRFSPSKIVAHPGDTLRFVNGAGRHNVDFVVDSNPRNVVLPRATPLLEKEGATVDIPVDLPPGRYYIQCDPHAEMGMVGHVIVERKRAR